MMTDYYRYVDRLKKDYELYHKMIHPYNNLIKDHQRDYELLKPFSKVIEETLVSFDFKKYIKQHPWIAKLAENIAKTYQQQYNYQREIKESTFLTYLQETTSYQQSLKQALEVVNSHFLGLGSELLYDVLNIQEVVKVEIPEEIAVPEVAVNNVIHDLLSAILGKLDELVKSNQTKPIIQNGWVQLFLGIFISFLISLYFSIQDDNIIQMKFKEQEILIEDAKKQIIDKIDSISAKNEWKPYIIGRPVCVMIKKSFKGTRITDLFRGEKVNVVRIENKWAYIEFFDYRTGLPNYGWVPKKYLKVVQ